jgi:hypothetical protein
VDWQVFAKQSKPLGLLDNRFFSFHANNSAFFQILPIKSEWARQSFFKVKKDNCSLATTTPLLHPDSTFPRQLFQYSLIRSMGRMFK